MSEREKTPALPCIVCGKKLMNVGLGDDRELPEKNQPYNGTAFATNGHYGSTVFDEFHGETIEINVCDTCLLDAAKKQHVRYYVSRRTVVHSKVGFWVPDADEDRVREIDRRQHGEAVA